MSQYESVFAASNRVALATIVVKEIRRFTRIWVQTLLPPAITMTLYFVIFGNLSLCFFKYTGKESYNHAL